MTLAERGERVQKGERMCVEGVLMAKDSFSWILGSSFACPRMTGEWGRGAGHKGKGVQIRHKKRERKALFWFSKKLLIFEIVILKYVLLLLLI
jgi:hypothetical protein